MRTPLVVLLSVAATGGTLRADEPTRLHAFGAAGLTGLSAEAIHLAGGVDYSPRPWLSFGGDLGYSYLPLGENARGGGNRAYWGLAFASVAVRPGSRVSPYAVLSYGIGGYDTPRDPIEAGRALALGAGLRIRVSPGVSLFLEGRTSFLDVSAAPDGLHSELPVRFGVRVGLPPGARARRD